jgi:phospholipid/cholesterol/gamma-HCH transport system substrate-binding protein
MATNGNALRAGGLIIATALVSLGIVVVVSGPERFAAKADYTARFRLDQNVQGLRAGDDVRLGGVRIGSVKSIAVDDTPGTGGVRVVMALPTKYTFHRGATVAVEGLIGGVSLNITSVGDGLESKMPGGSLDPADEFSGSPSLIENMSEAVEEAKKLTPKVDAAIEDFRQLAIAAKSKNLADIDVATNTANKLLEELRTALTTVVAKYNSVADEAKVTAKNFGDFIGPATGPATGDFHQSLANIRDATGKFSPLAKKLDTALDSINARLDSLKGTADDLRSTIADTKDVTAEVKSILLDNRPRIDRIIASIEGTANNAKAFTAEVLHRPSRLIWRDDDKTRSNLDVYFTAREFSEGAAELNDAAASLRDAVKDPRLSADDLKQRVEILNATFDRFTQVQNKLYNSVK